MIGPRERCFGGEFDAWLVVDAIVGVLDHQDMLSPLENNASTWDCISLVLLVKAKVVVDRVILLHASPL